jgi:uncharacterized damage-inducible protein DinB
MNARDLQRLMDYNYWAHRTVWGYALQSSEEQFKRPCDYSIGSVHEQIVHTMEAEAMFYRRARGSVVSELAPASAYPTREAIRTRWDQIEADWRTYLDTLDDAQLRQPVQYVSMAGNKQRTNLRWEILMHAINHGTDHRSQMLVESRSDSQGELCSPAVIHWGGGKTGPADFIFYTWEHPEL